MHNHATGTRPEHIAEVMANNPSAPPFPEVPRDQREFFLMGLQLAEQGTSPEGGLSFFDFEMTYWRERKRDNLLLVHYNDLKADLPGEMEKVGAFLGINTPPELLPKLAQAASFDAMKREGKSLLPELDQIFDRGADRFINQGTNGRWRDVLKPEDIERYETLAREKLTPSAARWIEHGSRVAGDPRTLAD
jgi:aryl sulfotransferase